LGPAPATISKINDIYRFVFYIKSGDYDRLIQSKDRLECWLAERQLPDVQVQFDFNPMSSM